MPRIAETWRTLAGRLTAELGIIVVGVTIALWADGWVTERADRSREAARLTALHQQITRSIAALEAEIENAEGARDAQHRIIDGPPADGQALRARLRYALLYGALFTPQLSVYDDLKNSGELSLLADDGVRNALADLDARLQRVQFAQDDLSGVQVLHIDSYIIDHTDVRPLYGPEEGLGAVPIDDAAAAAMLADPAFRNRMALKLDVVTQVAAEFDAALTALTDTETRIAARLAAR